MFHTCKAQLLPFSVNELTHEGVLMHIICYLNKHSWSHFLLAKAFRINSNLTWFMVKLNIVQNFSFWMLITLETNNRTQCRPPVSQFFVSHLVNSLHARWKVTIRNFMRENLKEAGVRRKKSLTSLLTMNEIDHNNRKVPLLPSKNSSTSKSPLMKNP